MTKIHTVQQGETLIGIAFKEGFRSWGKIWNHPQNEALRTKRSSPDDIYVGDAIFIPDKESKSVDIQAFSLGSDATQTHRFVVNSPKLYVSFALEDEDEDPYIDKPYQLIVSTANGTKEIEGRTTNAGVVNAALPPDARSLDLTLWPEEENEAETVQWSFDLGAIKAPTDSKADNTGDLETDKDQGA